MVLFSEAFVEISLEYDAVEAPDSPKISISP
jgi:hypothetical protein